MDKPDKTNNKGLQLLQIVGVDGDFKTFTIAYALLLGTNAEVYRFLYRALYEFAGRETCAAVTLHMSDEDLSILSGFRAVQPVCG